MKGELCSSGQEEPHLYCGSEQGGSGDVSHAHFTEWATRGRPAGEHLA